MKKESDLFDEKYLPSLASSNGNPKTNMRNLVKITSFKHSSCKLQNHKTNLR
jgi:hypothetical protein